MNGRTLVRVAAVIIVALAGTAAAIIVARSDTAPVGSDAASLTPTWPRLDPLHSTLSHCAELGELALNDHTCLDAWAQNRQRFLSPPQER